MAQPTLTSPGSYQQLPSQHLPENTAGPLVAVIVPLYKQPNYLKDAVLSAVHQKLYHQTVVVIVNDGCPYPSSDWLGRYFCDAFPGKVYYLKKSNGGLSSARNYGVRFALEAWPSVEAIFPLDADNKVSPLTLTKLWQALQRSGPEVGWIYQDVAHFGLDDVVWHTGLPFSLYRLVHENFCEAGSLIHRRVFEAGIWYDEEMREGYEDWEFFINAGLHGFRGAHAPGTGFLYRKRGYSMLSDARQKHEALHRHILKKHGDSLHPNNLTRLEHAEMPRFAFVALEDGKTTYFTSPGANQGQERPLSAFAGEIAAWRTEPSPKTTYVPPIVLFARRDDLSRLEKLRLLPGLLFKLQRSLKLGDPSAVRLGGPEEPDSEVGCRAESGKLAIHAMTTRKLLETAGAQTEGANNRTDLLAGFPVEVRKMAQRLLSHLRLGLNNRSYAVTANSGDSYRHSESADEESQRALATNARFFVAPLLRMTAHRVTPVNNSSAKLVVSSSASERHEYLGSHAEFAAYRQIDAESPTFPYCVLPPTDCVLPLKDCLPPPNAGERPANLFFVVPWRGSYDAVHSVASLAGKFVSAGRACRSHLVLCDADCAETGIDFSEDFATITLLPPDEARDDGALLAILANADVIIYEAPALDEELLPEIKSTSRAKLVSVLHELPPAAEMARAGSSPFQGKYEYLIDHFLVVSERLKRLCLNARVPEEKIVVASGPATISSLLGSLVPVVLSLPEARTLAAAAGTLGFFAG